MLMIGCVSYPSLFTLKHCSLLVKKKKKKKISGSTSAIAVFQQLVKLISLYEVLGYLR